MARLVASCVLLSLAISPAPECGEIGKRLEIEQYKRFELALPSPINSHFNRKRPDDVSIVAHFTSPSGVISSVGGFATRGQYKIRFTPIEIGQYSYVVKLGGQSKRGSFEVRKGGRSGFLRAIDHSFRFSNGREFIPLGENRMNVFDSSWNYGEKDIDEYLSYMKQNGMNALRVFTFSDCYTESVPKKPQLGCLEPELGRFDERTAEAIDQILESGERHGIFVVLTAYAIGFTKGDTWKGWQDNPYSAARGGPAKEPDDFLRSKEARLGAARRLRYMADRWAYSPSLLAVDLLNEPEWDGKLGERAWTPWAEEMAAAWRAHDPYHHPVTVGSVGLQNNIDGDERSWYRSTQNDVVEWHLYGPEVYEVHALAAEMSKKVRETLAFNKPVLCGEFAHGGEDKTSYDHTHVGIWSAILSGGGVLAHSAPPFQIDSDEPMTPERGHHFAVLRQFLDRLEHGPLTPHTLRVSRGVEGWALQGTSHLGIWLLAPKASYEKSITNAEVSIADLTPGRYRVSWWNDTTGRLVFEEYLFVGAEGRVRLVAPRFTRHIAATLHRRV
jgi:hypothetical protein